MHVQRLIAPGGSLIDTGLPSGEVRSVRINNPSGSWLQLFPTYDWIPPYTLGFARTFDNAVASVTIRASNGPAGQVSTSDGDAVRVVLDSVGAGNSAGSGSGSGGDSFIANFTPTIAASATLVVPVPAGVSSILYAAIPGARFRLRSLSVARDTTSIVTPTLETYDAPTFWRLFTTGAVQMDFGMLSSDTPVDDRGYGGGLDFPTGEGVSITLTGDWAQTYVNVSATAEQI